MLILFQSMCCIWKITFQLPYWLRYATGKFTNCLKLTQPGSYMTFYIVVNKLVPSINHEGDSFDQFTELGQHVTNLKITHRGMVWNNFSSKWIIFFIEIKRIFWSRKFYVFILRYTTNVPIFFSIRSVEWC